MAKEEEEDRISALPDCILAEILSRSPSTKDAITTGTLSKRWKHIWTSVPNLIFLNPYNNHRQSSPDFCSFVDKTLTQNRQLKLKKFSVDCFYDDRFESKIHSWIRYAVNRNVEELQLMLNRQEGRTKFEVDQFVFISSCFTNLTFSGCEISPIGKISWEKLRSLCIGHWNLDEDLIENILSGSPVLETLVLEYCYGFGRLDITSKSVKNLVFNGYPPFPVSDTIEINAPSILLLKIQKQMFKGKFLLLNVSSLVEADLYYEKYIGSFVRIPEEEEEETLKGFIQNLCHVKDLKIGSWCSQVLARLKAKGFLPPSNLKV